MTYWGAHDIDIADGPSMNCPSRSRAKPKPPEIVYGDNVAMKFNWVVRHPSGTFSERSAIWAVSCTMFEGDQGRIFVKCGTGELGARTIEGVVAASLNR